MGVFHKVVWVTTPLIKFNFDLPSCALELSETKSDKISKKCHLIAEKFFRSL